MKDCFLVIFIDSLPFIKICELPFLSRTHAAPLSPTFGYSEGIKPWMFAGISPEQSQRLGLWQLSPSKKEHNGAFLKFLDFTASPPYLNRLIRFGLRRFFRKNYDFVPFSKLKFFTRSNEHAEELLKEKWQDTCRVITYRDFAGQKTRTVERDAILFGAAEKAIKDGERRLIVASADLDHTAHRFGLDSPEYESHAQFLDKACEMLSHEFLNRNPCGSVLFFSDHGMSTVKSAVNPKTFGLRDLEASGFLYFIDATMLRIWTDGKTLDKKTFGRFSNVKGKILTDDEREFWGIKSRALGDYIFILDEGQVFCPSYFFTNPPLAMHGYHPRLTSQKGFAASNQIVLPKYPWEVYELIASWLKPDDDASVGPDLDYDTPPSRPVEFA